MKWLCVAHEKEIPNLASLVRPGWRTHAVGIGQFHSLVRFTELLSNEKPEAVILAGTCGSLDKADILRTYLCNHFAFASVPHEELPEFLEQNLTTIAAVPDSAIPPATALQNYGISLDSEKFVTNAQKIPAVFPARSWKTWKRYRSRWPASAYQYPFQLCSALRMKLARRPARNGNRTFASPVKNWLTCFRFCERKSVRSVFIRTDAHEGRKIEKGFLHRRVENAATDKIRSFLQ